MLTVAIRGPKVGCFEGRMRLLGIQVLRASRECMVTGVSPLRWEKLTKI